MDQAAGQEGTAADSAMKARCARLSAFGSVPYGVSRPRAQKFECCRGGKNRSVISRRPAFNPSFVHANTRTPAERVSGVLKSQPEDATGQGLDFFRGEIRGGSELQHIWAGGKAAARSSANKAAEIHI